MRRWPARATPCPVRIPSFLTSIAEFNPLAPAKVNVANNARAPLLLVAGGKDRLVPRGVTKADFDQYRRSIAITDYKEFPDRSHYALGEPGWEEVADYALVWAASRGAKRIPQLTIH